MIYALSLQPDMQARLRSEVLGRPIPSTSMDNVPLSTDELAALEKLPLLEAVVRETLRLHPPVPTVARVATKDDTVPLGGSVVDIFGATRRDFSIESGDAVFVPIVLINRSQELWGDDAQEWMYVYVYLSVMLAR
jgi:cytochrome P450